MDRGPFEKLLSQGAFSSDLYVAGELVGAEFICRTQGTADLLHKAGCDAVYSPDDWPPAHVAALKEHDAYILRDGADNGFAEHTAATLYGVAKTVRVLDVGNIDGMDTETLVDALNLADSKAVEWEPADGFPPLDIFAPPAISTLPDFPLQDLPPVIRDMVTAAAENIQVDPAMTAVVALAVVSTAVQGRFAINAKPGWTLPLNMYACIVARPSERKSPAQKVMVRPLYDYEREENRRRKPLVDEYRMKHAVLTKQIDGMIEQAARPAKGKPPIDTREITELQYQRADLEREEIKPLRLLAGDVTPEALISLMAANDGKMAIISDEAGIFSIAAGRYSGGKANTDVFLQGFDGAPLRVDRKGRDAEIIDHATLTMCLMFQPFILEAIMNNREFLGDGLLSRPLYAFPKPLSGHRRYETPPIPQSVEDAYRSAITTLLSIPDLGEARIIKVSPEAHKEAGHFHDALEKRILDDFCDMGDVEMWIGKYHGQVMRIAGVLHCCQHYENAAKVPVALETMKAAEAIGEYFLAHSQAAFQVMGAAERPEVQDAKYILKRINGQPKISKRDLIRLCRRFKSAEDMGPGLAELSRRGYIKLEEAKTGGRTAQNIILNPNVA